MRKKSNRIMHIYKIGILTFLHIILLIGCSKQTAENEAVQKGTTEASTTEATEERIAESYTSTEISDGKTSFIRIMNPNGGAVLSYAKDSGLNLIEVQDENYIYAFKDMNGNGELDIWEDWRIDYDTRAESLAKELSKEEIAGLMLFSSHERSPEEGLTEAQMTYLKEDNLRNVLNAGSNDIQANVMWNNEMQAYTESLIQEGKIIIPVNFSSDPRSTAAPGGLYNQDGEDISRWPSNLGIAATYNVETMKKFGTMSSEEYRAMGIATALGPQIDLASEPRWLRVSGTYGENTELAINMTEAYVNGMQSSYADGKDIGWGCQSVVSMIKHFPGDGMGEGGRESHTNAGKYGVYSGDNIAEHIRVFIEGGLSLSGLTKESASVMTSYSVSVNKDGETEFNTLKGTSYDKGKIDLLRADNNYDGVICTDWGVTASLGDGGPFGMAWGAEDMTVAERHYEILLAGSDMFGGNNDKQPVLEAYDIWQETYEKGELDLPARERFEESGRRLVKMLMMPGLFENPYLSLEESKTIAGSADKIAAGYQAQLDSIVMLKNSDETIKAADVDKDYKDMVVYIPSSIHYGFASVFSEAENTADPTMDISVAEKYFKAVLTDTPIVDGEGNVTGFETPDLSEVGMVIVGMSSPDNGNNFSKAGLNEDGTFYPLSLQYRPYTATGEHVRKDSIAGDVLEDGTKENRSYYGATSIIANEYDLTALLNAKEQISKIEEQVGREIPVIVALKASNAAVVEEFESYAQAIVVGFSVSDEALFDIILGKQEPLGLLPIQFPKNMDTVEAQLEDVPGDMEPYLDSKGNTYDLGYGLNYNGVISDGRTEKYLN